MVDAKTIIAKSDTDILASVLQGNHFCDIEVAQLIGRIKNDLFSVIIIAMRDWATFYQVFMM